MAVRNPESKYKLDLYITADVDVYISASISDSFQLNAASINSVYLFVFQFNLFICLWQFWQENRPDYFNMKLYVSQTDSLQVCVNHALLDANISVHFSCPYLQHQIRNLKY